MQTGEHFWVRHKQGAEWFIGLIYRDKIEFVGTTHKSNMADFDIGPKVIRPDDTPSVLTVAVSMRDQFAMAALAGFGCGVHPDRVAKLCYEQADAMMAERGLLKP